MELILPLLTTDRLLLRPISEQDVPALFAIWSDEQVCEFLTLDPFETEAQALGMVELLNGLPAREEGRRWAITDKQTGRVMGTCGYHKASVEHRRAEIGYEIAREFWGKGYMREALAALIGYCFEVMEFNRLEALVTFGNRRSLNVLRGAGFVEEGVLRNYEFARGRYIDEVILSLLRNEWHGSCARG